VRVPSVGRVGGTGCLLNHPVILLHPDIKIRLAVHRARAAPVRTVRVQGGVVERHGFVKRGDHRLGSDTALRGMIVGRNDNLVVCGVSGGESVQRGGRRCLAVRTRWIGRFDRGVL